MAVHYYPHANLWLEESPEQKGQYLGYWFGRKAKPTRPIFAGHDFTRSVKLECQIQKRWAELQRELNCVEKRKFAADKVLQLQKNMKELVPSCLKYKLYAAQLNNLYM